MLCGAFTAVGYTAQSIALVDTPAATVAFLGALTVVVVPALKTLVDREPFTAQTVRPLVALVTGWPSFSVGPSI